MKETTLKELGSNLPIGHPAGTSFARGLDFREWTWREEKVIGLFEEKRQPTRGVFTSELLAILLTKLYDKDLSPEDDPRPLISQMFVGDVLYAYIYLRYQEIGRYIDLPAACPKPGCTFAGLVRGDLDTLRVVVAESPDDLRGAYDLVRPKEIRGKMVEQLIVGPSRWHSFELLETQNAALAFASAAQSAIIGSDAFPDLAFAEHELEVLRKVDIVGLKKKMDEMDMGPDVRLELTCPECGTPINRRIAEDYDSFFG